MHQKVKIIPVWLIAILFIASGAGAAAGTVLAGKVAGEVNIAASHAILVGAPTAASELDENLGHSAGATAAWSEDEAHSGFYAAYFTTTSVPGTGDEARVVIPLPVGTTLGDIDSISWYAYMVAGYVPHADLVLDYDGDGLRDDVLVAEGAHQNGDSVVGWPVSTWIKTFEGASGVYTPWSGIPGSQTANEVKSVQDKTAVWMQSAADPNFGLDTLANFKAGKTGGMIIVNANTPVLSIEIEIDNWVLQSGAYVDDVSVNGIRYAINMGDLIGVYQVPQGTQRSYHTPNRFIGIGSDDNTGFEFAAEVAVGDMYLIALPLKNASDVPMVAKVTFDVPEGIELEVMSADQIQGVGNVTNAIRIGPNTWKVALSADADMAGLADNLYIAVSIDDTLPPGYHTITGEIKQISY